MLLASIKTMIAKENKNLPMVVFPVEKKENVYENLLISYEK